MIKVRLGLNLVRKKRKHTTDSAHWEQTVNNKYRPPQGSNAHTTATLCMDTIKTDTLTREDKSPPKINQYIGFKLFWFMLMMIGTMYCLKQIKQRKLKYFTEFSNIMDVVILIMAICCAAFSIYRTTAVNSLLDSMLKDPEGFPDFEFLSYWQETFNSTLAIMLFASWIKVSVIFRFRR